MPLRPEYLVYMCCVWNTPINFFLFIPRKRPPPHLTVSINKTQGWRECQHNVKAAGSLSSAQKYCRCVKHCSGSLPVLRFDLKAFWYRTFTADLSESPVFENLPFPKFHQSCLFRKPRLWLVYPVYSSFIDLHTKGNTGFIYTFYYPFCNVQLVITGKLEALIFTQMPEDLLMPRSGSYSRNYARYREHPAK